ncbi:hypothetical protein [Arthrobacter sp. NPDC056493]
MTTEENEPKKYLAASYEPRQESVTERDLDQAVKDYAYDIDALADEPND